MKLKVLLPFRVFASKVGVTRIIAETRSGSFGLLPQRLDCVAPLVPGILIYETASEGEVYLAVDEGVLVKTGQEVLVSVRRATGGVGEDQLHGLRDVVEQEYRALDEQEQRIRAVTAKLEAGLLRRLIRFEHD